MTDGPQAIVRVALKSWTHSLGAAPGLTRVELNIGNASERTDMCVEVVPSEARAIAQALLALAGTAERDGPR